MGTAFFIIGANCGGTFPDDVTFWVICHRPVFTFSGCNFPVAAKTTEAAKQISPTAIAFLISLLLKSFESGLKFVARLGFKFVPRSTWLDPSPAFHSRDRSRCSNELSLSAHESHGCDRCTRSPRSPVSTWPGTTWTTYRTSAWPRKATLPHRQ